MFVDTSELMDSVEKQEEGCFKNNPLLIICVIYTIVIQSI